MVESLVDRCHQSSGICAGDDDEELDVAERDRGTTAGPRQSALLALDALEGQSSLVSVQGSKTVLLIDGSLDFEGFAAEFSKLLTDYTWRGNLDAFNDIPRGGFGTPEGGFVLRWNHSDLSREALGYEATAARLESILLTCHPTNRRTVAARLDAAGRGVGPTLFDELVEIIEIHGPGGREADNRVDLELR